MFMTIKVWNKQVNSSLSVPIIDSLYDDIEGIIVQGNIEYIQVSLELTRFSFDNRDGPLSFSSKKRKQSVQDWHERRKTGCKPDMTIRAAGRSKVLEFGAAEAAAYYNGHMDRKYMFESQVQLLKLLKDMAHYLNEYVNWDQGKRSRIEVVGFVESALVIEFLTLYSPKEYICCLKKSKPFEIGDSINKFPKTLEVIAMSLKMKLRVE
ncbi:hypothetical protein [Parasitella parasitica]|uniref:Uncharacterized protein n=1 Tax=Parasitella parasitica TaxID=35722 RepID=A0A0B7N4I8_9FUNG|nr:hypothetical protein [Parasitella parasitica]